MAIQVDKSEADEQRGRKTIVQNLIVPWKTDTYSGVTAHDFLKKNVDDSHFHDHITNDLKQEML